MSTALKSKKNGNHAAIRLGLDTAGVRLSPAEFDAVTEYDECYRYELIHGVLVVHAIPSEAQAHPNEVLGFLLQKYGEEHPQGKALDLTLAERYVRLPDSRRLADRVIWAGLGRRPRPRTDVPTIAVEFVSAGKRNVVRDYVDKRKEYREAGVKEYWIFDRFQRSLTVHRNVGRRATEIVIKDREVYRTDLLPGFELPLGRILAAADLWSVNESDE